MYDIFQYILNLFKMSLTNRQAVELIHGIRLHCTYVNNENQQRDISLYIIIIRLPTNFNEYTI